MSDDIHLLAAAGGYATAHEAHYGLKDLHQALGLYEGIVTAHPDSEEAGYSRSQIQNIVKMVVPAPDLVASQVALARSHLATPKG